MSAVASHARPWQHGRIEGRLAVLTLARLAIVPVFVAAFLAERPPITAASLALFIVADVFDGVEARRRGGEGPYRRALDSGVDRIGIDAFLIAAGVGGAMPLVLVILLLVRDAYCAAICAAMMRRRTVAIKADWMYRSLNLSLAGWAVTAPFVSQAARTAAAAAFLVASLAVAYDLTRGVRRVLAAPAEVHDRVIPAGQLRAGLV